MNRAKWIKEIIGGAVEEHGFEYRGCSRDEYTYIYSYARKKEDVRQIIRIDVSLHEMELCFMTNAYGQDEVEGAGLIESDFKIESDRRIWWDGPEEFKKVLYHFREVIIKKGLDILEEISVPTTEIRPKKETQWKLYQEHEALNEEYRKRYGLEGMESTVELMKKISGIIAASRDREFAEAEELLIGMAAVYGDQLVKKMGGEWVWTNNNSCLICDMDGMAGTENPLADTIHYWKHKNLDNPDIFIREFKKSPFDIVT